MRASHPEHLKQETLSFSTIGDRDHLAVGYTGERKRSGQIAVSSPYCGVFCVEKKKARQSLFPPKKRTRKKIEKDILKMSCSLRLLRSEGRGVLNLSCALLVSGCDRGRETG